MATSTIPSSVASYETTDLTRNLSWVQQAFLLTNESTTNPDIDSDGLMQRLFTTASYCYNDTSPGGNWAINPAPQFCRFADITMGGSQDRVNNGFSSPRTTMYTDKGFGEGRYYHEVYEANAQYVTMSFGVPAFNSLTAFFGNFYDARVGTLVRTGRLPGVVAKAAFLLGSLLALPFKPLILVGQIIRSALNIPSTSYAYFRPAMTIYWEAVTTIVNAITANLGIHQRELNPAQQLAYTDPNGSTTDTGPADSIAGDITALNKFLPNIYDDQAGTAGRFGYKGGIDVYAIGARAQALADAFNKKIQAALNTADSIQNLKANINAVINSQSTLTPQTVMSQSKALQNYYTGTFANFKPDAGATGPNWAPGQAPDSSGSSDDTFVESMASGTLPDPSKSGGDTATDKAGAGASPQSGSPAGVTVVSQNAQNDAKGSGIFASLAGWFENFVKGLSSDLSDGSQYVTFKVDYGGPIGESFGNSFRPSDIEEQINSKVSSARVAEYNMAGGNFSSGILGRALKGAIDMVGDATANLLQGVHLQGLAALAGAAYVDIPKMFDSSSTTMPSQSFTIHLRSWSGHKLALLQNVYIPLAMLLAAVMPRATGPASYNAPFVCQLFAQGRMQVRYGMVTSMTIQRGTGNIGFTKENLPLGVDVTFEVTDFSSVVYMPIVAASGFLDKLTMGVGQVTGALAGATINTLGGTANAQSGASTGETIAANLTAGMYSDDSLFSDYMAILGGLSFTDQIYPFRKWSIARDRAKLNYDSARSPYHWALMVNGSIPGRIMSSLVRGTDRP